MSEARERSALGDPWEVTQEHGLYSKGQREAIQGLKEGRRH